MEKQCTTVTKRILNPERSVLFKFVFSITVLEHRAVACGISIVIIGEIKRSKPTLFAGGATPPRRVVATVPVGAFLGGVFHVLSLRVLWLPPTVLRNAC